MEVIGKTKRKKFNYFVGIDVSKETLDFAVIKNRELLFHEKIQNEPQPICDFVGKLKAMKGFKLSKGLFCMENTGFYCNHLLNVFRKSKINIVVENAVHIKNSMGLVRGKDDKIDAIRVARFAQKNCDDLKLWVSERPVMTKLKSLVAMKGRLMAAKIGLKSPIDEQQSFVTKTLQKDNLIACKRSIAALEFDILEVEKSIELLLSDDERLKRLMELVTSVHSIGKITARQFIICTNEFKDIREAKKFACYAGVAPFKKESGKMVFKPRVSHQANKKMKALLHMCAMVSLQSDTPLKQYFDRKTKVDGKSGMLVVNAIRNKLVLRVFACVRQDRLYLKDRLPEVQAVPGPK
ncbi:transposase [Mucilaginibacter sp.]|uniref:transposase n=1 Tax=Mucilaginibacter sp. TaxID=1882438 RepID=UPI00262040F1|nr:transposase [Mucilaginibacter sp.]MDB5129725.1 hypothetical protein [Mucilaginibacter sp.]